MNDEITFDNDVPPVKINVIREFNKNDDLLYKYTYKEFKSYKRRKNDAHGFDDPEDIDDDDDWF